MIKSVDELKRKSMSFIKNFIETCTVEEKIDTYYVSVEIRSKNNIVFLKSNGKTVDRSDLILNEMWQQLVSDWTYFKMVNQSWFDAHIGYRIHMFYFPCSKPLLTEYIDNLSYVIDRMEFNGQVIHDCEFEMKDMRLIDKFNISFKKLLLKKYDIDDVIGKIIECEKNDCSLNEIFDSIIDKENSVIYARNAPEGFIFKQGKKYIYQTLTDSQNERIIKSEKSQYEFLLLDFIKFWNSTEDVQSVIEHNYIKTVCNLFNLYIVNEKKTGTVQNNITMESIQSPCIGHRFDMCYTNIPDPLTVNLCKENELFANIFKILLVNLKRMKTEKHCILMARDSVNEWNEIVRIIANTSM